jgi:hypothetical protein
LPVQQYRRKPLLDAAQWSQPAPPTSLRRLQKERCTLPSAGLIPVKQQQRGYPTNPGALQFRGSRVGLRSVIELAQVPGVGNEEYVLRLVPLLRKSQQVSRRADAAKVGQIAELLRQVNGIPYCVFAPTCQPVPSP